MKGRVRVEILYPRVTPDNHYAQLPGDDLIDVLDTFLHKHLLHWIECLSELGELRTGVTSLKSASTALSVSFYSQ